MDMGIKEIEVEIQELELKESDTLAMWLVERLDDLTAAKYSVTLLLSDNSSTRLHVALTKKSYTFMTNIISVSYLFCFFFIKINVKICLSTVLFVTCFAYLQGFTFVNGYD